MTWKERKLYNYNLTHKIIDEVIYKKCTQCPEEEAWQPMNDEHYYKWKRSPDGFQAQCISCSIKKASKYQTEHSKERSRYNHKRYVAMPEYHKNKDIKWRENNPKRMSYLMSRWQKNNPDKVRYYNAKRKLEKEHKITKSEWKACKEYFDNCCAYCGLPIEKHYRTYAGKLQNIDLHKEHVIVDGRNDIKNCVPSCQSCNSSKGEYSLNTWYNINNPIFDSIKLHKIYMWLRYDYKKFIEKKKPKGKYNKKK
jgi:hypothetical protein